MRCIVEVVRLGRVPYAPALELQRRAAAARAAGRLPDLLLLLEHPHVFTLGRRTDPEHLLATPAELAAVGATVHAVERGGDVTYHGPGQLVGYPILDLRGHDQDLHRYLRRLEQTLIDALGTYGLSASRIPGLTGVWLGEEKVAAIGVGVRRWITLHGFALNVSVDLSYFDLIVPCGIHDRAVTSLHRHLSPVPTLEEIGDRVAAAFGRCFEVPLRECWGPADLAAALEAAEGEVPERTGSPASLQITCGCADNMGTEIRGCIHEGKVL